MLQKLHLIFMIFMNSYDSIISTVFVRIYDHVGDSSNETFEKHIKYAAIYLLYVKIEKIYLYFFYLCHQINNIHENNIFWRSNHWQEKKNAGNHSAHDNVCFWWHVLYCLFIFPHEELIKNLGQIFLKVSNMYVQTTILKSINTGFIIKLNNFWLELWSNFLCVTFDFRM